jgi:hypothetical protein
MPLTLIFNPLLETAMLLHLLSNSLLDPEASPLMAPAAVQTSSSVVEVHLEIAAPGTDTAEKAMTIVAMAVKQLLVFARAFPPTLSAGPGMARRVRVLVSGTVVLRMGSAERLTRTAVKAGKLFLS